LATQGALDDVVAVEDGGQAGQFVVGQFLGLALRVDAGLLAQAQGQCRADALEVTQRDVRRLVVGNVNAQDTRHVALLNPDAVCVGGWCRSPAACRAAGSACSSHKYASRSNGLSRPFSFPALDLTWVRKIFSSRAARLWQVVGPLLPPRGSRS